MNELNTGADWEQSKRLVIHWHNLWAKEKLKVDWYEAPEKVKHTARMYAELSAEDQKKIDDLMAALIAINGPK